MTPTSRDRADHYGWGDGCDGWHLVRSAELSVVEERMPPGAREPRHRHARARQFFYVLAGTLTVREDAATHRLGPSTGVEIAPTVAHEVINETDEDVRFLVISQPPSHGDRVE